MKSGFFLLISCTAIALFAARGNAKADEPRRLRVCADPDNLPFSDKEGEGFENRIATLVAEDLGMKLEYFYWPHRRGFMRNLDV